jgi:uncharacterized FlaG/YvyC family protein
MEAIKALSPKPVKGPVEVTASNVLTSESNAQKDIIVARTNEVIHQNAEKVQETTNAKINRIAEAMDNYVRSVKRELKIQVHSETGDIMVKVISQESGKVIREIPPKELLDLAARMEEMTGTLLNENV